MHLGLYIHIPFCRKKCDYCGFYSVPLQDYINYNINYAEIDNYISILIKELRERSGELEKFDVDTIYFGGGTPSLLSHSQLGVIINEIYRSYKITDKEIEFTIECNPDDFSIDKVKEYKRLGVNRIVLGVQTTDAKLHSVIGRSACLGNLARHSLAKMLSDYTGIRDIVHCIDMIVGIPGQTEDDLERELNRITSYRFEHISAYTLSIEPGTPLAKRAHAGHAHTQRLNDMQRVLLEQTIDHFTGAGYEHYEVSNYALPAHQSKHNIKYWKFLPYAGFGPGAHSFYNGERYYNMNSVNEYIKSGGNVRQNDARTKNSEIVEYILSGMRLNSGISFRDMENTLNIKVPGRLINICKEMNDGGLLRITASGDDSLISFTRNGFFQMDSLIFKMTEMFL